MIDVPENIPQRKRIILGPLARLLLKLFKWDITGTIPNLKKMILIGAPHSAMRDAWYGLLAVLALDLKVTFFGASWIFTRLPSLITFSTNLDRLGIPWPLGWLQKIILIRLGGVPVYRVNSRGTIRGAIEEFAKIDNYILLIAPEAGTEVTEKFRSGFYYLAKELDRAIIGGGVKSVKALLEFATLGIDLSGKTQLTNKLDTATRNFLLDHGNPNTWQGDVTEIGIQYGLGGGAVLKLLKNIGNIKKIRSFS